MYMMLIVMMTYSLVFCRTSYASRMAAGNEVIGIDLGTTNSCVAVMDGKVGLVTDFSLSFHVLMIETVDNDASYSYSFPFVECQGD